MSKWDKTFKKDHTVNHRKINFTNRFGINLCADMYWPKNTLKPLPSLAVCGPFGAVKEQASGLYAQTMATKGYLCLAFDPSFTGESWGYPRNVASPDINTEDYQAAIDFLSSNDYVDDKRIGIIGICGWGGIAVNAAAIDTGIKATVAITMYDMSRVNANGYFDLENNPKDRLAKKVKLNHKRNEDYRNKTYELAGGVSDQIADNDPDFVKDYYNYYKTARGYHERSLNSNKGWNTTSALSFINTPMMAYCDEIERAVLLIHGEKAHSLYFSQDTFKRMNGDNKELLIVPSATHTDLYDRTDIIPFDKIDDFFKKYL